MIDNLTEAISHAREVANEKRFMEDHWTKQDKEDKWHDKRQSWITECKECAEEHEQLAAWLTELQERREADRWIPVSEGLPKEGNKAYLVTIDYGNGVIASCQRFFYNGGIGWNDDCVIAWKPLPKPYKENYLKPTKDLINDIVGFDVSGIKPLPEYKKTEGE